MVTEAMNVVLVALNGVFEITDRVFDAFGAWGYILGAFIIITICRLLLFPIIGGVISTGQSDTVQRITKTGRYTEKNQKNNQKNGGNQNG